MRPTRISASSRFYTNHPGGTFSPVEMIDYFHDVGFRAVDFDIETVPAMGEDWKRILSEMAERAARKDVLIEMGHLPFHSILREDGSKDREQFHRNMLRCIEAAGYIGIKHAVIHPKGDPKGSREQYEQDLAKNIEYMTPYVELAERVGVKLAFENMRSPLEASGFHRNFSTADELIPLADHFGQGICWDFGHAHTTGLIQSEELRKVGSRLICLHVNDNHAGGDEHLLPFFGSINWADAMKGLGEIDFGYCFNYECRMIRLPGDVREYIGRHAVALGHKLVEMMG
ncbi:MAG: sugar phosphate isomerase/epimerase [Clostridia bacterium]|nr:sugar phosphate isomerase/epimerase [Clostridia bacterium]